MKSFKALAPTALAALLLCQAVAAQTVYRCGNSYSQSPCAGASVVNVDDARTDAQREAARQGLAGDKALARDMEASRHRDEALALARAKAQAGHAARPQKPEDSKAPLAKAAPKKASLRTVKVQEPEAFTATTGSAAPRKKKSAKH